MAALKDVGAILAVWDVEAPLEQLQKAGQGQRLLTIQLLNGVDGRLNRIN